MYEKFIEIKSKKPWLFYLLIIPFVLVWGYEMYSKYLVNSGKEIVKETEEADVKLKADQDKAEAGGEYHKEEADKIEEKIDNINVDEDWHKK